MVECGILYHKHSRQIYTSTESWDFIYGIEQMLNLTLFSWVLNLSGHICSIILLLKWDCVVYMCFIFVTVLCSGNEVNMPKCKSLLIEIAWCKVSSEAGFLTGVHLLYCSLPVTTLRMAASIVYKSFYHIIYCLIVL